MCHDSVKLSERTENVELNTFRHRETRFGNLYNGENYLSEKSSIHRQVYHNLRLFTMFLYKNLKIFAVAVDILTF